MSAETKKQIPGWFVALAVVVTAGLTFYAIMTKRADGTWPSASMELPMRVTEALTPAMASVNPENYRRINSNPNGMGQLAPGGMTRQMPRTITLPPMTAPAAAPPPGANNPGRAVAAQRPIPPIRVGVPVQHEHRGACASCHAVVDKLGKAIPAIRVMAPLPHQYKGGLCINCHTIMPHLVGGSHKAYGPTLAAGRPGMQGIPPAASVTPNPVAPKRIPTEGAWLGVEVAPITPATAAQYNIPGNIKGLVTTETEAQARTAGIKAGDVIVAIHSVPISDMKTFLQATGGGRLPGGEVVVMRGGKFLKAYVGAAPKTSQPGQVAPAAGGVAR